MQTFIKETVKGSLAVGVSSVIVIAISFLLIAIYTRQLSVEEFGLLGLTSLTSSIIVVIFGLGLNTAIIKSYYDDDEESGRNKVLSTAFTISLFSSFILIFMTIFFGDSIISQKILNLKDRGIYFQVALLTAAINLLKNIPFALYQAQKLFARYATLNIILSLFQLVIIVFFVPVLNWGLMGVLFGLLITNAIITVFLLVSIHSKLSVTIDIAKARKLLSFGAPLVIPSLFNILINSGGLYIVQATSGLTEVGVLNLAIKIASVFSYLIIIPFQLIWPPILFSVEKQPYAKDFYASMLTYAIFIASIPGLILSVFATEFVHILGSPDYFSSISLISILVIGHLIFLAQNIVSVGIMLSGKTIYWSLSIVAATIVSLIFWLVLVPRVGMIGVVVGTTLGYAISAILTFIFSRRLLDIKYESGRLLILALLYLSIIWLAGLLPNFLNPKIVIFKIGLILSFIGIPFLIRFWHQEELSVAATYFNNLRRKFVH